MTWWALVGNAAVSDDGTVRHVAGPRLATWYRELSPSDIVWTWDGGADELVRLAESLPDVRWGGRVGQGSLLSIRAVGGAEVRETASLLPWLNRPAGGGADAAAELLSSAAAEVCALVDRGYSAVSDRGVPRLTVGSVAWHTAARLAGVTSRDTLDWAEYDAGRRAYTGGRAEVGSTSEPSVHRWDITAAYPWALRLPVPVGRRSFLEGRAARVAWERERGGAYLASVYQRQGEVPLVPYREGDEHGRGRGRRGRLLWCTGHVSGWYTGPELETAADLGAAVTIHAAHTWDAWSCRWAPYVEHAWRDRRHARETGDSAREASAKLLANALSGKLAQGADSTAIKVLSSSESGPSLGWHWHGGRVFSKPVRHVPPSSRPIEAAYVTARVRTRLTTALHRAEGDWVYCDTDSLYRTDAAPPDDGTAARGGPGSWLYEGHATDWTARAPKAYRCVLGDGTPRVVVAGITAPTWHVLDELGRGRGVSRTPRHGVAPPDTLYCGRRVIQGDGRTAPPHRGADGTLRWRTG